MTEEQTTSQAEDPKAPADGEQDVEGHKIPREGGTQGGLTPDDDAPGPDGNRAKQ